MHSKRMDPQKRKPQVYDVIPLRVRLIILEYICFSVETHLLYFQKQYTRVWYGYFSRDFTRKVFLLWKSVEMKSISFNVPSKVKFPKQLHCFRSERRLDLTAIVKKFDPSSLVKVYGVIFNKKFFDYFIKKFKQVKYFGFSTKGPISEYHVNRLNEKMKQLISLSLENSVVSPRPITSTIDFNLPNLEFIFFDHFTKENKIFTKSHNYKKLEQISIFKGEASKAQLDCISKMHVLSTLELYSVDVSEWIHVLPLFTNSSVKKFKIGGLNNQYNDPIFKIPDIPPREVYFSNENKIHTLFLNLDVNEHFLNNICTQLTMLKELGIACTTFSKKMLLVMKENMNWDRGIEFRLFITWIRHNVDEEKDIKLEMKELSEKFPKSKFFFETRV